MVLSGLEGLPVRVIRGPEGDPSHRPAKGYRYDGLFRVDQHWSETGKSGFLIWRFRLVQLDPSEGAEWEPGSLPTGTKSPKTTRGIVTRTVRETKVSKAVKVLHKNLCQVCDTAVEAPVGRIAEGAHIRGLGRPHYGPDTPDNLLCLCPNHHAQFDKGGIYVDDDLNVYDHNDKLVGQLTLHKKHVVDMDHLRYHRERIASK